MKKTKKILISSVSIALLLLIVPIGSAIQVSNSMNLKQELENKADDIGKIDMESVNNRPLYNVLLDLFDFIYTRAEFFWELSCVPEHHIGVIHPLLYLHANLLYARAIMVLLLIDFLYF